MRALVVHPGPSFSVADVHDGYVKGLRANGVEVAEFNLSDRLDFYGGARVKRRGRYVRAFADGQAACRMAAQGIKAALYDFWPDVLVIVSAFFVPPEFYPVFRARRHKVVILHTEEPYEHDLDIARAPYADLNVLNDPTHIEAFRDVAPTVYIPHGFDPERHHPRPPDPECKSDFCFVGTGYPSRIEFLEQVDWSGIDVTLAGNWQATTEDSPLRKFLAHPVDECCPNEETVRLYTSSKVSANLYRREAQRPDLSDGWAMTPREVELAACGVFFAREKRGEGDEVFPMLPTFAEPDEFEDLVRWWTAHDAERKTVAEAARQAVQGRTFAANAAALLRAISA